MKELDRYLELEDLRFRAALIQARIGSGLTRDDLVTICRDKKWVDEMEDPTTDVLLSSIRRYCAMVGIAFRATVLTPASNDAAEDEVER